MALRIHTLLLASTALLLLGSFPGSAGPDGPVVVGGQATVTGAGSANVQVNQTTNNAIINWNTFNIGTGQSTTFVQPGTSSVALNRVTGGLGPSQIYGTLTANGHVFPVNPDACWSAPRASSTRRAFATRATSQPRFRWLGAVTGMPGCRMPRSSAGRIGDGGGFRSAARAVAIRARSAPQHRARWPPGATLPMLCGELIGWRPAMLAPR